MKKKILEFFFNNFSTFYFSKISKNEFATLSLANDDFILINKIINFVLSMKFQRGTLDYKGYWTDKFQSNSRGELCQELCSWQKNSRGARQLKHTSFCREFNCQQRSHLQKNIFHVSIKITQNHQQLEKTKFWNFFLKTFLHFVFSNCLWFCVFFMETWKIFFWRWLRCWQLNSLQNDMCFNRLLASRSKTMGEDRFLAAKS